MQKHILFICIVALALVIPVSATTVACPTPTVVVNNNISVANILTQIQWMTQQQIQAQQQSQAQQQEQTVNVASGTTNSWINSGSGSGGSQQNIGGIVQESQTYSRLVYPGEVIAFPVEANGTCTLLSGLPVAFYTIGAGHGYFEDMVQTSEATPVYDPIYHKMDYGHVPVINQVGYWTMKAKLRATGESAFCVIDNRAPMNGYTTIEVTVA